MKTFGSIVVASLWLLSSIAAHADVYFVGDTTGGPTFHRPQTLTTLSASGTAVAYQVIPFWVNASGTYEVDVDSQATLGFTHTDQYIFVYAESFDPASPLANLINGDDDHSITTGPYGPLATFGVVPVVNQFEGSRIAAAGAGVNFAAGGLNLTAFTQYFLVVGGFNNTQFGSFQGAIGRGPGDAFIGAIPEPGSFALVGLISILAAFQRHRTIVGRGRRP